MFFLGQLKKEVKIHLIVNNRNSIHRFKNLKPFIFLGYSMGLGCGGLVKVFFYFKKRAFWFRGGWECGRLFRMDCVGRRQIWKHFPLDFFECCAFWILGFSFFVGRILLIVSFFRRFLCLVNFRCIELVSFFRVLVRLARIGDRFLAWHLIGIAFFRVLLVLWITLFKKKIFILKIF